MLFTKVFERISATRDFADKSPLNDLMLIQLSSPSSYTYHYSRLSVLFVLVRPARGVQKRLIPRLNTSKPLNPIKKRFWLTPLSPFRHGLRRYQTPFVATRQRWSRIIEL